MTLDLYTQLAPWFILALFSSNFKIKMAGQRSRVQVSVVKLVRATWLKAFQFSSSKLLKIQHLQETDIRSNSSFML